MTFYRHTAALFAATALVASMPISAQVSHETRVTTSNNMDDGVPSQTTKVVHVKKYKTHHPKRILGVKVGHKTRTVKRVRKTTVDANGNTSTSVETRH
jgi:hypothetical protein